MLDDINDGAEADDAAPKNSSKDYLFVKKIRENIKRSRDHLKKWRDSAREAYEFFAGQQWAEEDVLRLKEEDRPAVVFNRIPRVINAVAGLEIQNRQEVSYKPRTNESLAVSDIMTDAANWVRDSCDAEDEESQAFKDALMCGIGWTDTGLDYETDPDGMIFIERIDPLEMLYDPHANKRNLDNMTWVARERFYSKDEFKAIWPEFEDEIFSDFTEDPKGMQPHDDTLAPFYINDQSDEISKKEEHLIEVVQYQWWEREAYYRVEFENGEVESFTSREFKSKRQEILMSAKRYIRQHRKKFKQAFIAGSILLERGDCPVNAFTFRAITGFVDHQDNLWFGLIELMKDPQRWANKWLSQIMHILNSNSKGGYLAELGAFANPRQAEESLATTSITYVNEDMLEKVREKAPPGFPQGIDRLLQYALSAIPEVVGINLEILGQTDREQSGVVEMQRKKAAITVIADFFDSLRRYRKEQGRVLADFIKDYISDGRLVRLVESGLDKYVPLTKNKVTMQYDIIVDESPTSPDQRQMVFDRLVTLFPMIQSAGIPIPDEILDYAPLPSQLIAKWKQKIEDSRKPNPEAQEIEALRKRLAEAETALKEKEVEDKSASVIEKQTKSALNIAKAAHENSLAELEGSREAREIAGTVNETISQIRSI